MLTVVMTVYIPCLRSPHWDKGISALFWTVTATEEWSIVTYDDKCCSSHKQQTTFP